MSIRTKAPAYLCCITLLWSLALAEGAANRLRDVEHKALPGDRVRIDLILSEAPEPPRVFVTDSPPRIALDLHGVSIGQRRTSHSIDLGSVLSLVAVEASDRTRVVINLKDSVPYQVDTSDDRVTITVGPAAAAGPPPPQGAVSAAQRPGIREIDFRRGAKGEGLVLISLPSATTRVSVAEKGDHLIVDIPDTTLAPELARRLEVADSGTPVVAVESRSKDGDAQIDIGMSGAFEYLTYQADELLTLEFRRVKPEPKESPKASRAPARRGDRLSLNFQDIEVRAVLQLLADFTGLNLVASDTVRGNITLRLKNVPWDQALDLILTTKGLDKRMKGNVILVAPAEELALQEQKRLQSQQTIEELAPVRSEFIQVNYAKAADLAAIIKSKENNLLSERGNATVDARTNTLLIQDTPAKLADIRRIVGKLDIPVGQVMIETRVVIANSDFARDLGVRFGLSKTNQADKDNKEFSEVGGGLSGYLEGSGDYANTIIQDPDGVAPLLVDLPAINPSGAANFLIGKVGSYLLQLELSAMQTEGRGEIISSPRVITSDQRKATIKVGQEIPYQESSASGRTTVSFKEAVLQLEVTPHITPDDRIVMDLKVNKDNPDFTREVLGVPPVDTRAVETSVLVDNGETLVLGGVHERTKSFSKEQVPWLGNLPVVGNLFKTTSKKDANSELLIFVTPRIVKEDLAGR